jgi:hydrogenase 3 maturation protease
MDRIFDKIKRGKKAVILGIGNRLKGDDGVGSIIAEKLKEKIKNENLLIIDAENKPENYIGIINKFSPSFILIIDAIDFKSSPGDFKIFSINQLKDTTISTHNFSLPLFKKLLGNINIYILGIQVEKIEMCEKISKSVSKTIEKIIKIFYRFLNSTN